MIRCRSCWRAGSSCEVCRDVERAAAALEEDNAAAAQAEPTALNAEESIVPDWYNDTEGALD